MKKFDQFIKDNLYHQLNEGVYDKTTGDVVDDCWKIIKFTKLSYDMDNSKDVVAYDIEYRDKSPNIDFNFQLIIKREISEGAFSVDADIDDEGVTIRLFIKLNPSQEPLSYSKLNSKLHDAIRHELEHSGQKPGMNWKKGKPEPTKDYIRTEIQTTPGRIWEYFLLEDEVPAMVRGMYKQAKVERNPLDKVFKTYLSFFVSDNQITQDQMNVILEEWIKYAKSNLPSAIFSRD